MVARVGDFGVAKFFTESESVNRSNTVGIRGNDGYVDPEYGLGSTASTECDVYSCGILLLELVTKKPPTNTTLEENIDLHTFVEAALPDRLQHIIDENITEEVEDQKTIEEVHPGGKVECIVAMASIGLACSKHLPLHRMAITDAVTRLQAGKDRFLNVRHTRNI